MVRLQVLTGARPQEIRLMRASDFERVAPDLWYYRPREFKTEHIDPDKVISIVPQGIRIVSARLEGLSEGEYLFSPRKSDAEKIVRLARPGARKTPSRAESDRLRAENPSRRFNDYNRRDIYALAIKRACIRAGVLVWTPYQLRKMRGTEIDRAFGAETAAVLGYKDVATTLRHHIDPRREQADAVARKCG